MSPIPNNAAFSLLESNPKKYIAKPSSAVVMLVRLLEGVAALFLLSKVYSLVPAFFSGTANGVFTLTGALMPANLGIAGDGLLGSLAGDPMLSIDGMLSDLSSALISSLLPPEMQSSIDLSDLSMTGELSAVELFQSMLPSAEVDMKALMAAGTGENILCGLVAAGFAAVLLAAFIEAIAFIPLFFFQKLSAVAKGAHKVLFLASLLMLLSLAGASVIFFKKCKAVGIVGTMFSGELRTVGIMMAVMIVLLLVRTLYHRDVSKVLAAVDYEIRSSFKDNTLRVKKLPAYALAFALIFAALTAIVVIRTGFANAIAVIALALIAVKYVMIYSCWTNYRHCHM